MKHNVRNWLVCSIVLALEFFSTAHVAAGKKPAKAPFIAVENKQCGYWIRYPRGSTLDHPSDCALKITLPLKNYPKWVNEVSFTLYTAPLGQEKFGEEPDPASTPGGFLAAGRIKFLKKVFLDAGMSHRWVTVFYEAQGKNHRYQLKGFMNSVVPEVMDQHPKNWDPEKSAEKIFDGMALNFRPLE